MGKIAAVVVTYNRFELVKKTIDSLRNQTKKLDSMIIIDNNCTDGTSEWLDTQYDLTVIHQENVGGSGGFWRGIKEAYERGFDWIWCMDDDVFPREECLEEALKCTDSQTGIVCPKRIMNGKVFISESTDLNLSNIFKWRYGRVLTFDAANGTEPIEIQSMTFEGPLIRKDVVKEIGLPNKDLFILFDDTDYAYRTHLAGFKLLYATNAIMDKHFFGNQEEMTLAAKSKWKIWYDIRNASYFAKTYGKNWMYRNIGEFPFVYLITIIKSLFLNGGYKTEDLFKALRMYMFGKKKVLGKI